MLDEPNNPNPNPDPNTPPAPIDPNSQKLDAILGGLSQLTERQNAFEQRQKEIEERLSKPVIDQPPAPAAGPNLFEDPTKAMAALEERVAGRVKKDMEDTVAPLKSFVSEFAADNQYTRAKDAVKADPRFAKILAYPGMEAKIDEVMAKNPNKTPQTILAAMTSIYGGAQLGLIPGVTITPDSPNPNPSPSPDLPPTVRSTPQPPPRKEEPVKMKPLDENERKLARQAGMTDEEYRAAQGEGTYGEHQGAIIIEGIKKPEPKKEGK